VLRVIAATRLFPRVDYRWWSVVKGASRHSWQQRSINVIIKGCRIKRRPKEVLKTGVWDLGVLEMFGILNGYFLYFVVHFYFVQLTLSTCVWQWSCNALHGSRWYCKWYWWGI